jgi:PAP2 superfamily
VTLASESRTAISPAASDSRSPRPAPKPNRTAFDRPQRRLLRFWAEVLLVVIAFQAYRLVRLATEGDRTTALRHAELILRWEHSLGLSWEHGVQSVTLRHDALVDVANTWYTWAFWPVVTGAMFVLYVLRPELYRRYRNAVLLSGAIGLVVFALFPVAPPRMLGGFVDTVHLFSSTGGLAHPTGFTNEYAAMPSFHVGWLVLVGVVTMPAIPRRALRPLLLVPAGVMFVVVMATANHFVLDGVAGAGLALFSLAAADRLAELGVRRRLRVVARWGGVTAEVLVLISGRAGHAYREALAPARRGAGQGRSTPCSISVQKSERSTSDDVERGAA